MYLFMCLLLSLCLWMCLHSVCVCIYVYVCVRAVYIGASALLENIEYWCWPSTLFEERSLSYLATMDTRTSDWGVSKDSPVSTSHVAEGVPGCANFSHNVYFPSKNVVTLIFFPLVRSLWMPFHFPRLDSWVSSPLKSFSALWKLCPLFKPHSPCHM